MGLRYPDAYGLKPGHVERSGADEPRAPISRDLVLDVLRVDRTRDRRINPSRRQGCGSDFSASAIWAARWAADLLKGGYPLRVWNRSPAAVASLAANGAEVVATPAEAFDADIVITMLADDAALRAVLIDSGLIDQIGAPLIHLNMATISVAFAADLASRWAARGVDYVAAPVMGRPDAAAAAKLNILVAGPDAAVGTVQPLSRTIGRKTWRIGRQAQLANVAKLTVNFMLASAVEHWPRPRAGRSARRRAAASGRAYRRQYLSGSGLSGLWRADRRPAL